MPATFPESVEHLLNAARDTIRNAPFFWVVTAVDPGAGGGANARIVNGRPSLPGDGFWIWWFLTPRAGRKAAEIKRTMCATLAYQDGSGNAFVTLVGTAEVIDDRHEVNSRFRGSRRPAARLGPPPRLTT